VVKNGQVVDHWNADGGNRQRAGVQERPVCGLRAPAVRRVRQDPGPGCSFEAPQRQSPAAVQRPGRRLSNLRTSRPGRRGTLRNYTALTGLPPSAPPASLGIGLSNSFNTSYDEARSKASSTAWPSGGAAVRSSTSNSFRCESSLCDLSGTRACSPTRGTARPAKARACGDLSLDQSHKLARSRRCSKRAGAGYLLRRRSGDVWRDLWQPGMARSVGDFTNRRQGMVTRQLDALLQWAWTLKVRISASDPCRDVAYFDGRTLSGSTTNNATCTTRPSSSCSASGRGDGRRCFPRFGAHRGVRSASPCTGAATATRTVRGDGEEDAARRACSRPVGCGYWSHDIGGLEGTRDSRGCTSGGSRSACSSHSAWTAAALSGAGAVREAAVASCARSPAEDEADAVLLEARPPGDGGKGCG